jgi:hypothetical protein
MKEHKHEYNERNFCKGCNQYRDEAEPITENTSDGFHTFKELYDHRIALFIALMKSHPTISWCSKVHHDGSSYDGWFIAGMDLPTGQISYHLPMSDWDKLGADFPTLDKAPEWDGHTPADVVKRLTDWNPLAGTTGTLYGITVAHQSNVGDPREHTNPPEECWCWDE